MNPLRIVKKKLRLLFNHFLVKSVKIDLISVTQNELLKGRCAIITGGTSGIGYAIAEAFVKSGCSVIITGRSKGRLDNAVSKLSQYDTKVGGFVLDNTNVASFEPVFTQMQDAVDGQPIDILVNNAGVNFKGMPYATEEEYDSVLDTNLKGTFFLSQIFGKYMVDKGIKGNILNVASASSLRPANSAYILSKWGIRSLTLGLAKALAKDGITVNGIAPGPTATPMLIKDKQNDNMALDRLPLGRYIMPEEVANMAVILVSSMGRAIMGDIIYMTGGAGILTYDDMPYSF